jgi:replicative DNA helicase
MNEQYFEKPLPSSPDTERVLLGTIFLDNDRMNEAVQLLDSDYGSDFYVPANKKIWLALVALHKVGMDINPISVKEELQRNGDLESVGGMIYLSHLSDGIPRAPIIQLAKIIRGKSMLRQLINTTNKITCEALEEEDEPQAILESAERAIFALRDSRKNDGRGVSSMKQIAVKSREHLSKLNSSDSGAIATPWEQLNNACRGGLNRTELWGLLGVQKHGKSAAAKQLAAYAAGNNHRVLIFSREMSNLKIFYRMLAPFTDIPVSQIRFGLDENRIRSLVAGSHDLEDLGIFIDDYTSDMDQVRTKTREMVRLENIDLVIGDYTNQFSAKTRKGASRADEVASIWRGFKNISQEFDIASLALSHPTSESYEKPPIRKGEERVAPYFHQSAESREAAKAVDVGLVLWTELGKGEPGARPATIYIDYQRDEDAGGSVPLIFNGRAMEFRQTDWRERSFAA